jgi:antitoxin ParD1/3/4
MNVSLTPELEDFVTHAVRTGFYHTSSEVVREGLRLLKERDELHRRRVEAVQREIALGIKDLDEGRLSSGTQVRARLRKRRAARKKVKA